MKIFRCVLIAVLLPLVVSAMNSTAEAQPGAGGASAQLAQTPPMGWNSWNKFACDVSEQLIRGND